MEESPLLSPLKEKNLSSGFPGATHVFCPLPYL